jgi:hypothetical protein
MRFVVGRFTRLHNIRRRTDGAVFRGRFVSKSVNDDSHLLECLRYIHLNPVDAGLALRPEAWPWSSARAYDCSAQSSPWLIVDALLEMFGPPQAREQYRRFMDDGVSHPDGVRPGGSDTG